MVLVKGASGANKDNCSPNTQSAGNTAIVAFTSPPLSERLKNLSLSTLSAYKTPVNSTTSPPLSARLKNLSLSLRALAPLPVNMPRVAELDVTPLKCKSSTVDYAVGSLERNFAESNFNEIDHQSPLKLAACDPMTPALGENLMLTPVSCTGTPFDRFSRTNPELQVNFSIFLQKEGRPCSHVLIGIVAAESDLQFLVFSLHKCTMQLISVSVCPCAEDVGKGVLRYPEHSKQVWLLASYSSVVNWLCQNYSQTK